MKKYFVKQSDATDCGVSCLQSIIMYYNGYINKEILRIDTCTNTKGTSAYHLIKALEKYGFSAKGVKCEDKNIPSDLILPAIFHIVLANGYNHFVVVYEVHKDKIVVMDPMDKIKSMSLEEFKSLWTGIIISMYPMRTITYTKKTSLKSIFGSIIKDEKKLLIKTLIFSIILTISSIGISFFLKSIMENLYMTTKSYLYVLMGIFGMILIIKFVSSYIRDKLITYLNKNVDIKVIFPFLSHILYLPSNVLSSRSTGDIITRIGDLERIKDLFSKILVTVLLDLSLAFCSSIILFKLNAHLFTIVLGIYTGYIIYGLIYSKMLSKDISKSIDAETEFNNLTTEYVSNFKSIKNNNNYHYFLGNLEKSFVQKENSLFRFYLKIINSNTFKSILKEGGIYLLNCYGLIKIISGNLTLIDLITFTSLLTYLEGPIESMINLVPEYHLIAKSFLKISEFSSMEEEDFKNKGVSSFHPGDIVFKDVSFSYNNYDYILDKVNLTVPESSFTILKAPSGMGKSTLCKMLYRLITPNTGEISIKGINISDYSIDVLRNNITYLSQEESIFTDTIKNNILLGKEVSLEKLDTINKICGLERIFINKPLRYETMVSSENYNLSGGEKERILLARALIRNTPILILDEALSQLEEKEEERIITELKENYQDKTIIYITHRNNYTEGNIINLGASYEG